MTDDIALLRESLEVDRKMCLCGALASEADALSEPVRDEARRFFASNLAWLETNVFADATDAAGRAALLLGGPEGGLLLAKILESDDAFDRLAGRPAALV